MNNTINFQKYLCVDPSFFSSIKRLNELPKVLKKMQNNDSQIVLPSLLKPLSKNMRELDNGDYPLDDNVLELLQKWYPEFNRKNNSDYRLLQESFSKFQETFRPIFADELVGDLEKIGPESIHLSDVLDKLGNLVGKTIFELMAVCSEKSGIILSYGRKSITFIRKISTPALEGYSNLKHSMIDMDEAPEYLKILGLSFATNYVNDFINHFDIVGLPIPVGVIGEFGLLIVADG